jgi:hypothetical protein
MRAAFLLWRDMRSSTVGRRLSRIQHSSGCKMLPKMARMPRKPAISVGSRPITTPARMSLWPAKYLVAE